MAMRMLKTKSRSVYGTERLQPVYGSSLSSKVYGNHARGEAREMED